MIWMSKEQKHADAFWFISGKHKAIIVAESETEARRLFFKQFKTDPTGTVKLDTENTGCVVLIDAQ